MTLLTLLIISLFASYPTNAVLYVDIKNSNINNIDLVVSKCACKTEVENKLSESITKVIETNRSKSCLFNVKRGIETESR